MTKSRLSHRNSFRKLFVETLQDRRLMAADMALPLVDAVQFDTAETPQSSSFALFQAVADTKITRFESQAEALETLTQMAVDQWKGWFGKQWPEYMFMEDRVSPISIDASSWMSAGDSNAFSGIAARNIQTVGVDEADNALFSNDGHAFVFRDQAIRIIDIRDPKDLKEVSRIDLSGMTATMQLVGDQLVVVSHGYQPASVLSFSQPNYFTQVKLFDVSAKDAPAFTGGFNLDGTTNVSRLVNGKLVLVQNTRDAVPNLQMINEPGPFSFSAWASRYETEAEYLDRITPTLVDSMLINYQQIGKDGKVVSEGTLGDWRDIALAGGKHLTKVVSIDLNAEEPKLDSMESVLGGLVANAYVTENSIYFTYPQSDGITRITQVDLGNGPTQANVTSQRGVTASAFGDVRGTILNSRFMDEYDGYLRVVTSEDGSNSGGRIRNSANVFVLKLVDGELKTVGSLLDISPGDQAYGAEFDGPRAFVTTGFVDPATIRVLDPLHGIDLSDPTQPKELSDVIIPGITNYVQWVDSSHLLGIGMVEEQSQWFTQVSLYDVTDIANPKTIDVWRGTEQIQPNFFSAINPLDIHYDALSKTLTVPQAEFTPWWRTGMLIDVILPIGNPPPWNPPLWNPGWDPNSQNRSISDVIVLAVDLDAEDPLSFRALVGDGSGMGRAVVVDDSLVVLSRTYLSTYAIEAPTLAVDRILLSNPLRPDHVHISDTRTIINVLENDSRLVDYEITAIKREDGSGNSPGTVTILPDQTLEYTRPIARGVSDYSWWDSFIYEVTTADGSKFETTVSLWGTLPHVDPPLDVFATANVFARAYSADDSPVASVAKGDEFWVEVLVQDGRDAVGTGQGVYSAYVDLGFDTSSFDIVGDAEHLGAYTNGTAGGKTSEGWKNLGGFSNSPTPLGTGAQSLVRFKLRATADAAFNMTISRSDTIGSELTLYGIDSPLSGSRIAFSSLQLPQRVDASASISLKAYDAENKPVTSTAKGDEFWIEVALQDGRSDGQGVYSAYVDLGFDTSSFEIVGDSESLGGFTNRLSGEKTSSGWKNLGGFRDTSIPTGPGSQSLVRFKLRATEDAVLNMTVTPSSLPGSELTLYGVDTVIPIANITLGSLQLPRTELDYDVNGDGIVSPIDSLIVINRINREGVDVASTTTIAVNSSNQNLDVNQDGMISLLDALSLINRINRDNVVPMMNTVESNDITKKKA